MREMVRNLKMLMVDYLWFHIQKAMNLIHHINRIKNRPYDHLNRCMQKKNLAKSDIHLFKKKNPNFQQTMSRRKLPQSNKEHL